MSSFSFLSLKREREVGRGEGEEGRRKGRKGGRERKRKLVLNKWACTSLTKALLVRGALWATWVRNNINGRISTISTHQHWKLSLSLAALPQAPVCPCILLKGTPSLDSQPSEEPTAIASFRKREGTNSPFLLQDAFSLFFFPFNLQKDIWISKDQG